MAFRRSIDFLSRGRLYLKNSVKVMTIYYNVSEPSSTGLRWLLRENIPQIQYKNPQVQIVAFKNTKNTPQINIYNSDDTKLRINCEFKKPERILKELTALAGKPDTQIKREQVAKSYNPGNFGDERKGLFCACRIPGQVPCPSVTPILNPQHPWKNENKETLE